MRDKNKYQYQYKTLLALSISFSSQIVSNNLTISQALAQTAAKPELPRAVQVQARKTSSISHAYEAQAKQALRALDTGDYLTAINLWTKLNSDYPNKAEPYYQRAVVRRQIGDLRGALEDLDHALAISPNLAGALVQRAAVRHRLNDLKGAQLDIERACELTPNNYQALAVRGSVKYALGDFQGALADYNQASAINPDMGKRVNKYVTPQVGQSISSSQQALESQFAANMSNIQVDKQSTDKANFYSANSTTGNTKPGAPQVQASWQVNKRSPKREAESGTNLNSNTANSNSSNLNSANTAKTQTQSESSRYEEIPTYSPSQLAHLNNQAAQAINNKQFSLAVEILEKIIKASPDYEHGRENLVIAHNNWGLSQAARNPKEAMKQFRAALYIDPTQPASRRNLNALIKENEEDPESAELRMRLSDELKEKDDLEGAYVEITEALRLRNTREGRSKLAAVIGQMERMEAGEATASATARGSKAKADQLAGAAQPAKTRPVKKAPKPYVQEVLPSPSAGPVEETPVAATAESPAMQPQIIVSPQIIISPQAPVTAPDTIAVGEHPRNPEPNNANEISTTADQAQLNAQAQPETQAQPHVKAFDQESMLSRLSTAPEEVLIVARQFATEGNFMDAEELLVKLIEHIRAKQLEMQNIAVLESALETLTNIYQKQHKPDKEEVYLRALVKLQERSHHPDDAQFGKTLAEYATVLKLNGKAEEAAKQETRATAILGRISRGSE